MCIQNLDDLTLYAACEVTEEELESLAVLN